MKRSRAHPTIAIALLMTLLAACAPAIDTRVIEGGLAMPVSEPALAIAGAYAQQVSVLRGTLTSAANCTVRYELHRPLEVTTNALVVVGHGFLRNLGTMRGWATHLASHGIPTVVVGFCASTPFDGRHDVNARDLQAVAGTLKSPAGGVVYAGFSAGGLAALLAADSDPAAIGLLGLDAVDSGALASGAQGLVAPALFLTAEPSSCNAQGNMVPVASSITRANVIGIPGATHCHFEDPYDPLCEVLCGRVEPESAANAIRSSIRALATGWLLDLLGLPRRL